MSFRDFILRFFTWWNGQTIGTWLYTRRYGRYVGEDLFHNRYYENPEGRRWVIYPGYAEASAVPPSWSAWLQGRLNAPPLEEIPKYRWEKPHEPNKTGTPQAHRPSGRRRHSHPFSSGEREGYAPWSPHPLTAEDGCAAPHPSPLNPKTESSFDT